MDCYLKPLLSFRKWLGNKIGGLGRFCAHRPFLVLSIFMLVVIGLASGLYFSLQIEYDGRKLWVDQNSRPMNELIYVEETFEVEARFNQLIVRSKTPGANVLTVDCIEESLKLHNEVMSLRTDNGFNYSQLCGDSSDCYLQGPLKFWNEDLEYFQSSVASDADIASVATALIYPDYEVVQREVDFGRFQLNATQDGASAEGFVMNYGLVASFKGSLEEVEAWEEKFLEIAFKQRPHLRVTVMATRSLDDELSKSVGSDIILMAIAYTAMIMFASFTLGQACSSLHRRSLVATMDVFVILFSTGAAYGLACFMGIPFTSMAQILIFLLLAVGIDIAFVIAGSFDQTDSELEIEERMFQAMQEAGMSITVTSLTDLAAFLLAGLMTKLPAVQWFGQYAAIAIGVIYLAHLTAFPALLALDARRVRAGRADCAVCCSVATSDEVDNRKTPESVLGKFLRDYYAPVILKPLVKIGVVIFFCVLSGLGIWNATKLDTEFSLREIASDQSYLQDYYDSLEDLWDSTIGSLPTALYFKQIQYDDEKIQAELSRLAEELLTTETIDGAKGKKDWHTSYTTWAKSEAAFNSSLSTDGRFIVGSNFLLGVKQWLTTLESEPFRSDIVFSSSKDKIVGSRIWVFHHKSTSSKDDVRALEKTQELVDSSFLGDDVMVSSSAYIFFHQYAIIVQETFESLGFALIAVTVICGVLVVHPVNLFILVLNVVLVLCVIVGSLPMWGLSLNSVSSINLLLAIGLVCDYIAHISFVFSLQDGQKTRNERVTETLYSIGPAVCLGIFTTFLGVLPLAFAQSQVFRVFFKMFFSIVVTGAGFGLVFLPVVLSIIGPSIPMGDKVSGHGHKTTETENPSNTSIVSSGV